MTCGRMRVRSASSSTRQAQPLAGGRELRADHRVGRRLGGVVVDEERRPRPRGRRAARPRPGCPPRGRRSSSARVSWRTSARAAATVSRAGAGVSLATSSGSGSSSSDLVVEASSGSSLVASSRAGRSKRAATTPIRWATRAAGREARAQSGSRSSASSSSATRPRLRLGLELGTALVLDDRGAAVGELAQARSARSGRPRPWCRGRAARRAARGAAAVEPGDPAGAGVEVLEHPLDVVGAHDQQAVAPPAAAGPVLDLVQPAPRQPDPGAAEPQPDAEVVGDEQRRAGVEQRGQVGDPDQARARRPATQSRTPPPPAARAR